MALSTKRYSGSRISFGCMGFVSGTSLFAMGGVAGGSWLKAVKINRAASRILISSARLPFSFCRSYSHIYVALLAALPASLPYYFYEGCWLFIS